MVELNEKDKQLLAFCRDRKRSVGETANFLDISPKNVSVRLKKLLEAGLIKVERGGKGYKTYIRYIEGDKTKKYMIEALKILKKKGEMSLLEFHQIFPFFKMVDDKEGLDKKNALTYVEFSSPALIDKVVRINRDGERFLKGNK